MIDPTVWSEEVHKYIIRAIITLTISGYWVGRSWRNHWYIKKDNWKRFKKILGLSPPMGEYYMYLNLARTVDFLKFADDLSFIAMVEGNFYEVFRRIHPLLNPDIEVEFRDLIERSFEDIEDEDMVLLHEDWEFANESIAAINLQAWYTKLSKPVIGPYVRRRQALVTDEGHPSPEAWLLTGIYLLPAIVFQSKEQYLGRHYPGWNAQLQARARKLEFWTPVNPDGYYDLRAGRALDIYFNDSDFITTWASKSTDPYFKVYLAKTNIWKWELLDYESDQWRQRLDRLKYRTLPTLLLHPHVVAGLKGLSETWWFLGIKVWATRLPLMLRWNAPTRTRYVLKSHEINRWENASLIKWEFKAPFLAVSRFILDTECTAVWNPSFKKNYVFYLLHRYAVWAYFFYNIELPMMVARAVMSKEGAATTIADMTGADIMEVFNDTGAGSWWMSDTKYLSYRNYNKDLKREKKEERIFLDKVMEVDDQNTDLGVGLVGPMDFYWEMEHSFEDGRFHNLTHPARIPPIYGMMYRSVRLSKRSVAPSEIIRTGFEIVEVERYTTPGLAEEYSVRDRINDDIRRSEDSYFETLRKQNNLRIYWFTRVDRPDSVRLLYWLQSKLWPLVYSMQPWVVAWARRMYDLFRR